MDPAHIVSAPCNAFGLREHQRGPCIRGIELLLPILSYVQSNAMKSILAKDSEGQDGRPARLPSSLHQLASTITREKMLHIPFLRSFACYPFAQLHMTSFSAFRKCPTDY